MLLSLQIVFTGDFLDKLNNGGSCTDPEPHECTPPAPPNQL